MRERFWFSEPRRYETLHALIQSEGICEVAILATCNRTEYILWADDCSSAVQSVRTHLAREFNLQEAEWDHFYRFEGDEALGHVFRVTAGLDSMIVGEPHITGQVKSAWTQAHQAGATGLYLDTVFKKALTVSRHVRNVTAIGDAAVSVPYAAVELARQVYGDLAGRKVLILGAGKMGELSARYMVSSGARPVLVTNRTYQQAVELARKLHGLAIPFEDRWQHLTETDIVISSTGCPHAIFTKEDAERIQLERQGRRLLMIDIAVPRDVDPSVQDVPGIILHNIDDLQQAIAQSVEGRRAAAEEAEGIVAAELRDFRRVLAARRVVPTLSALNSRLEEIRSQEMDRYRSEVGSLSEAQEQALEELTTRTVQRITSLLGRELRESVETQEEDNLMTAVRRLFRLPQTPAPVQSQS
jgi:glutamyl-tRNA reductase